MSSAEAAYPLSPMQQGICVHSTYAPEPGVHIIQMCCTLRGTLDVAAFERAWQRVLAWHPALRVAVSREYSDAPQQVVYSCAEIVWERYDWSDCPASEQQERFAAFLRADRARGFDLSVAPLFRLTLIRQAPGTNAFIITLHRLILDGWSCNALLNEVWTCYEAFRGDHDGEPLLPELTSYRQYIASLESHDRPVTEAFWRQQLRGVRAPTPLGSRQADVRDAAEADAYDKREIELSASQTDALCRMAHTYDLTLNTLVLGTWALLLARYSREDDVVFGTLVPCRPRQLTGAESVVGQCTTIVPMRAKVPYERVITSWLQELEAQQADALSHSPSPLVEIQGWSDVPRNIPLFESIVLFDPYIMPSPPSPQGHLTMCEAQTIERTGYPLTLVVVPGAHLGLQIIYDRRRFDANVIMRMAGHICTLLESMSAGPERRLSELQMLTQTERQQLLIEWNATQAEYPEDRCIHQLFEDQVAATPDAVAVVNAGQHLTYRELNARANQLAYLLRRMGVGPDVLVGLCVERSLEMVVGMLGVLKAGGAYVPLDPAYPAERLAFMLEDAEVPVLLTQQHLVERLPGHRASSICLDAEWAALTGESEQNPDNVTTSDHLVYMIYTSGSTGRPKGVMIPHRALVNHGFAISRYYNLGLADRILQFASISFDAAAEEMFPFWLSGAAVVLRSDQVASSFQALLECVEHERITVLDLPTAYWHEWVVELARTPVRLPSHLRLVIIGGEKALPERWATWKQLVGDRIALSNSYGPTEATITATIYEPVGYEEPTDAHAVPIGRPLPNVHAYVLDPYLNPVPIGVAGELHIGGVGLARGYRHRPELTGERFIPHPFSDTPTARVYKTGDLARYQPDGTLEYLGRLDHQVKIRGFRIELGEIEAILTHHPAVRDAVVVAHEDSQGHARLVAYVVADAGPAPSHDTLARFLQEELPYYMVPSAFVMLGALPMTPSGKVDRRALPAPGPQQSQVNEHTFVPPRLTVHHQLTQIWEELLNVHPVGVRDDFFDLGGHSLLAARLVDRVEQVCGKRISLSTFYAEPTVEHLARMLLRQSETYSSSPLVEVQAGNGERPLFFLHGDLRGGGFYCWNLARRLGPAQPFYVLEPHGVGERPIPHTIPDMAAAQLALVRSVQPDGPYRLGGFCNGGLVAYEMAQQLYAEGQEVELLFLVNPATASARQRIALGALRIAGNLMRLDHDAQFGWYLRLRRSRDKYWQDLERAGMVRPAESPRPEVWAAYDWAMAQYRPRRYPGQVLIIWSEEDLARERDDLLAWWRNLAPELETRVIPGAHNSSVTTHVDVLATQLATSLRRQEREMAARSGHA